MKITVCTDGVWYHGSPQRFDVLRTGSTVTQWRELAEAFSHKPSVLWYEEDGTIFHNGTLVGYLYEIAEPIVPGMDVVPHPRTAMDPNAEFLTCRPLRVKQIAKRLPDLSAAAEAEARMQEKNNKQETTEICK